MKHLSKGLIDDELAPTLPAPSQTCFPEQADTNPFDGQVVPELVAYAVCPHSPEGGSPRLRHLIGHDGVYLRGDAEPPRSSIRDIRQSMGARDEESSQATVIQRGAPEIRSLREACCLSARKLNHVLTRPPRASPLAVSRVPFVRSSAALQSCDDFVQWLRLEKPDSDPRSLVSKFRDHLLRSGATQSEVEQNMPHVWRCAFRDREALSLLWNKVYAGDEPIFVDAPTRLLAEVMEQQPPGAALDVGMGQGRNAIYLALKGWRVTGFDPSDEGIRIARAAAERAGVRITTAVATDDEFDFGSEAWDLIVVTYVKVLDRSDADRIERALRRGGILVYENAATDDNQVLEVFSDFRILRFEDVLDYPDWNPREESRIQRLVAQRR